MVQAIIRPSEELKASIETMITEIDYAWRLIVSGVVKADEYTDWLLGTAFEYLALYKISKQLNIDFREYTKSKGYDPSDVVNVISAAYILAHKILVKSRNAARLLFRLERAYEKMGSLEITYHILPQSQGPLNIALPPPNIKRKEQ